MLFQPGKLAMKLDRGGAVSGVGFFGRVKRSQPEGLPVKPNDGTPLLPFTRHALESASVMFTGFAIACVLRICRKPEIRPAVIHRIAVNVIAVFTSTKRTSQYSLKNDAVHLDEFPLMTSCSVGLRSAYRLPLHGSEISVNRIDKCYVTFCQGNGDRIEKWKLSEYSGASGMWRVTRINRFAGLTKQFEAKPISRTAVKILGGQGERLTTHFANAGLRDSIIRRHGLTPVSQSPVC